MVLFGFLGCKRIEREREMVFRVYPCYRNVTLKPRSNSKPSDKGPNPAEVSPEIAGVSAGRFVRLSGTLLNPTTL